MSLSNTVNAKAIELGKYVVRMTTEAGSGHPSTGLSLAHIVITLMHKQMRWDPADPWNAGADRLVLSEGHAVPIVYAAYADLGGVVGKSRAKCHTLTAHELDRLRTIDSELDGHPNPAEGFPFFDAATGSLGQGLSIGAGLGAAAKLAGSDKRIFVIIGDGESREGQIWEAADFIVDHKLTNVTAIFNCNGQGQADYVSPQQSAATLTKKLLAFGWDVKEIDGHDVDAIDAVLSAAVGAKPLAVIARTVKGWGVSALQTEGNHGKPLTADQIPAAEADLDAMYAKLNVPHTVDKTLTPPRPKAIAARVAKPITLPPFADAMREYGQGSALEKRKFSTRRAYGVALAALGKADERIVALDGDVSNSTFANIFAKAFPKRFFECKIAEQNLISAAAGMAAAGYIPFASSFAKFLARGYDQIEMASITRANIKLCGSHSGVSLAADGPSQMSLPDMAFFRSFTETDDGSDRPACVVFHPADAIAAYHCTALAANLQGMCYVRTHRPDVGFIYDANTAFEVGGSHQLVMGSALTIVSSGYMVTVCREAVEQLAAAGVKCTLIDAYSFPLNAEPILVAAKQTHGKILVVEDNYVGGFAGAVAEAAAKSGAATVESIVCKRIPKSAKTPEEMLTYLGLSVADIVKRVKALAG
ncbi:MAG: transketolase [Phycisphaerae bacterium]|nr:transketolase [Phycisphaerae bacterium]